MICKTCLFQLLTFGFVLHVTQGLRCYTCSVGENDFDTRCITDPANVEIGNPITNCNKKFCTSMRQEYIDPKGKVASMVRGCEDKPQFLNQIQEDGTYRYYFRACKEDLCNDGTGYSSGNKELLDQDTGGTIYAEGIDDDGNNKSVTALSCLYLNTILLVLVFIYSQLTC